MWQGWNRLAPPRSMRDCQHWRVLQLFRNDSNQSAFKLTETPLILDHSLAESFQLQKEVVNTVVKLSSDYVQSSG